MSPTQANLGCLQRLKWNFFKMQDKRMVNSVQGSVCMCSTKCIGAGVGAGAGAGAVCSVHCAGCCLPWPSED